VADYERGAALRKRCEALLAEAEQKVQAIVEATGGPTLRDAG
jgi:exodeoxyribonuclease VII small subunit